MNMNIAANLLFPPPPPAAIFMAPITLPTWVLQNMPDLNIAANFISPPSPTANFMAPIRLLPNIQIFMIYWMAWLTRRYWIDLMRV